MNDQTKNDTSAPDRIIPLTMWPHYHPWPPIGGLRHLVFFAPENGFDHCLIRKGRRVLISERRFFEWANRGTTLN